MAWLQSKHRTSLIQVSSIYEESGKKHDEGVKQYTF